ncbi:MAG TPA: hypothetical protein VKN73_09270 [Desulfosalsimonadaceae bacterium]|nr:hypothetical protein [Desulfosalsimonadaceae bacterium]
MKLFQKLNPFDRLMAAISFAEANEQDTAIEITKNPKRREKGRRAKKAPENRADNRERLQM